VRIGLDYRPALLNREGIGRYARELVRALGAVAPADELLLFGWSLAAAQVAREELGLPANARLRRLRFPSRWLAQLARVTGRHADDLVGGAELWHHTQPSAAPVRRAVEVVTVFDCIYLRDEGFLSPAAAAAMSQAIRARVAASARVLVPSHFVADDVERHFGVARERLCVTPLGADHLLRVEPDRARLPREPFVLTVARVDARKNHLTVLRAFERLCADGLPQRWIVAGPAGHRAEEFAAALNASPVRERVEWRQFVGERELAALYAGCAAFLFPSRDEGFGLPPLEAMALGAPVVAGRSGSLPEVLGDAAAWVEPLDVDALHRCTRELLLDHELAEERRRAGRAQAARFTWTACAAATRAAYAAALSDAPRDRTGPGAPARAS